jgi:hypothetical protein
MIATRPSDDDTVTLTLTYRELRILSEALALRGAQRMRNEIDDGVRCAELEKAKV